MTWTVSNLVIQIVAGIIGGNVVAFVVTEHRFGIVGHTITGLIGGFLSGYFLQTLVNTVVDSAGTANEPQPVDVFVMQLLAGLACGAITMMVVGFTVHAVAHHKASKE